MPAKGTRKRSEHYVNNKEFLFSIVELIKPKLNLIENRKNFDKFYITKKYSNSFGKKLIKRLYKFINYDYIIYWDMHKPLLLDYK